LKNNEEKLERLNLILQTIRNINRLIVNEKDRSRLLEGVCANLTENRSYYNAWIAILEEDRLTEYAEAGLGRDFLPMAEEMGRGKLSQCAEKALIHSEVISTDDPISMCKDCPLSAKYADRGAMTIRLAYGEKVYGILCVSIPKELIRDEEERDLFKEVADDISFSLNKFEAEDDREIFEKELEKSEQRFRKLVESSIMGISIIEGNQVVYQNPSMERILGPLPRKFKLIDIETIHPDDIDKVKQFHKRIDSGNVPSSDMDFRFFAQGGLEEKSELKWVYCRAISIEYHAKDAIMVNMMDITHTKDLEQIARIQDKMSSLGRVAAGIAHEIRNPLSGINIYLNTLNKIYKRADSLDNVNKIIEQIQSASKKIEIVVKRVMDFSKPSEPKFVLMDINIPIEEAIDLSAATLRKRGIKLEKSLSGNLPQCNIDMTMIEEIILNMITNATEAMQNFDGEKRIEVATSIDDNNIILRVSDSGPGVPINIRDKVLDPFYSTKNDSTGIGLSLCQRIIIDHGGRLDLIDSRWGGAEFIIKIPIKT